MKDLLLPLASLLPNILIILIVFYFYYRKKLQGLLLMGGAYIVFTLITAFNIYGISYFQSRYMSAMEIQRLYEKIGIVSIVAQLVLAIGLGLVLIKYPDSKEEKFDPML